MPRPRIGADDNWEQSPEWHRYRAHVKKSLIPMIKDSAVSVSIVPRNDSEPDIKFSIELGLCIMLNKPILLFARADEDIPPKLRLVADDIIIAEGVPSPGEPDFERISNQIAAFVEKYGRDDDDGDEPDAVA